MRQSSSGTKLTLAAMRNDDEPRRWTLLEPEASLLDAGFWLVRETPDGSRCRTVIAIAGLVATRSTPQTEKRTPNLPAEESLSSELFQQIRDATDEYRQADAVRAL